MGTFVAAYAVVWLALAAYVARLGLRQRRLEQTLDQLRLQGEPVGSGTIDEHNPR